MTLSGVVALILRYFTEFGSFRGVLRKVVEDIVVKKVHVRYLVSSDSFDL